MVKSMFNWYIWERIPSGWECVDSRTFWKSDHPCIVLHCVYQHSISRRSKSDDKIKDPNHVAENCGTSTSCIRQWQYQRSNKTTRELQSKRSAQRRHYKHHEIPGLHHIMYPIDQSWILQSNYLFIYELHTPF